MIYVMLFRLGHSPAQLGKNSCRTSCKKICSYKSSSAKRGCRSDLRKKQTLILLSAVKSAGLDCGRLAVDGVVALILHGPVAAPELSRGSGSGSCAGSSISPGEGLHDF